MTETQPRQSQRPATFYAPAERAPELEIEALAQHAIDDPILAVLFDAVGGYAMVLDQHRQIIAANEELLTLLEVKKGASLVGLRPGEAVQCVHAHRGPGGCGTSVQCTHCGAVAAIMAAQVSEKPIDGQCSITHWADGTRQLTDFRLRLHPLELNRERVYVAVFQDITATKWRELQNRMFVHDMANMLTGLSAWSSILADEPTSAAAAEIIHVVRRLSETLQSHRLLLQCESGDLKLLPARVVADVLKAELRAWFDPIVNEKGCLFRVNSEPGKFALVTDVVLLMRVLGNLVMNAVEACASGDAVTLTIQPQDGQTVFAVHNKGIIPALTAAQLFKTRFSTKGPGRGLGMYAVQVFGEQFLGGRVDFETNLERGTVFRFTLPNVQHP